jgi:hypothetical protein
MKDALEAAYRRGWQRAVEELRARRLSFHTRGLMVSSPAICPKCMASDPAPLGTNAGACGCCGTARIPIHSGG